MKNARLLRAMSNVSRVWREDRRSGGRASLNPGSDRNCPGGLLGLAVAACGIHAGTAAKGREPACKPGSVVDSHSSGTRVAARLERPTRGPARAARCGHSDRLSLYSVLLRVGFTLPPPLPVARCALTAPFHPYRHRVAPAVYFLWHFPWARAPQALPGTLPCGARTFLQENGSESISCCRSRH